MRSYARVLIVLGVLGALASALWLAAHTSQPQIDTGALFAASFPDSQGQTQAIKQWRGKVLVVNFWATWCPPCCEEMPELSGLQEKYRADGLAIVGIATDDIDKMRDFARLNPAAYPLLAGDSEASNLADGLGNDRSVLPYTVLIGRDGRVIASYYGLLDMPLLEGALQPLLNTPPLSN
jgi:thiol-disulfide isomerase/thioredoxin